MTERQDGLDKLINKTVEEVDKLMNEIKELVEDYVPAPIPLSIIAVDFDGTCVAHEYPKVGRFIGAEAVLAELVEVGHKLILWTMRSGEELDDAVNWFKERNIPLYGVNENPTQKKWTQSPKAYAQLYIDDAALGVPLSVTSLDERPFVDWDEVRKTLVSMNLLPRNNQKQNEQP